MFHRVGFENSVLDEFRRLQDEVDGLFGSWSWPMGIRSLPPGSFPAVNVGSGDEKVEVYLFAPRAEEARYQTGRSEGRRVRQRRRRAV